MGLFHESSRFSRVGLGQRDPTRSDRTVPVRLKNLLTRAGPSREISNIPSGNFDPRAPYSVLGSESLRTVEFDPVYSFDSSFCAGERRGTERVKYDFSGEIQDFRMAFGADVNEALRNLNWGQDG